MVVFLRVLILSSISFWYREAPGCLRGVRGLPGASFLWCGVGEWWVAILVMCICLALCGVVHKLCIFWFSSWVSALGCLICGRALL